MRNIAVLFIFCNTVYWFFPFPPVVWRVGLVLLSLFVIIFREGKKAKCEKLVLSFAALNLIYFFLSYYHIAPSTTQLGNILCALLSLNFFAYLGEKGVMTESFFAVTIVLLIVASVFGFYHGRALALARMMNYADTTTVNESGPFLLLLPMVFFLKKDFQKALILGVCIFYLLLGAKRGSILAAIIPVVMIVWYMLKNSSHSVGKTVLIVGALTVLSFIAFDWIVNNDYLMHRFEQTVEGDSSGRDAIYAGAWRAWSTSNSTFRYFFGFGFDGASYHPMIGCPAHSDWLEILVDYGIVGIVSYLAVFFSFAALIIRTREFQTKMILLSCILIWFFSSIYSMGFTSGNMPLMMMSLGTAVGWTKRTLVEVE